MDSDPLLSSAEKAPCVTISITPQTPEPQKRRTSIFSLFRRKSIPVPPPFTTTTTWIPYDWFISSPPPPKRRVSQHLENGIQTRIGDIIVCPCGTKIHRYLGRTFGEEGEWVKYVQKKGESIVDFPSLRGSEIWDLAFLRTENFKLLGGEEGEMDFVRYFQGVECMGCGQIARHDLVAVRVALGEEGVQRCAFV